MSNNCLWTAFAKGMADAFRDRPELKERVYDLLIQSYVLQRFNFDAKKTLSESVFNYEVQRRGFDAFNMLVLSDNLYLLNDFVASLSTFSSAREEAAGNQVANNLHYFNHFKLVNKTAPFNTTVITYSINDLVEMKKRTDSVCSVNSVEFAINEDSLQDFDFESSLFESAHIIFFLLKPEYLKSERFFKKMSYLLGLFQKSACQIFFFYYLDESGGIDLGKAETLEEFVQYKHNLNFSEYNMVNFGIDETRKKSSFVKVMELIEKGYENEFINRKASSNRIYGDKNFYGNNSNKNISLKVQHSNTMSYGNSPISNSFFDSVSTDSNEDFSSFSKNNSGNMLSQITSLNSLLKFFGRSNEMNVLLSDYGYYFLKKSMKYWHKRRFVLLKNGQLCLFNWKNDIDLKHSLVLNLKTCSAKMADINSLPKLKNASNSVYKKQNLFTKNSSASNFNIVNAYNNMDVINESVSKISLDDSNVPTIESKKSAKTKAKVANTNSAATGGNSGKKSKASSPNTPIAQKNFQTNAEDGGQGNPNERIYLIVTNSDGKHHVLMFQTEAVCKKWLESIEKVIISFLEYNHLKTTTSSAKTEVHQQGKRIVNEASLNEREGNTKCADCGYPEAKWLSMNLGIFLCIDCSGVHRSLNTTVSKVRSMNLDNWSQVSASYVAKVGNNLANSFWNYKKTGGVELNAGGGLINETSRQQFIMAKYRDRMYAEETDITDDNIIAEMFELIMNREFFKLYKLANSMEATHLTETELSQKYAYDIPEPEKFSGVLLPRPDGWGLMHAACYVESFEMILLLSWKWPFLKQVADTFGRLPMMYAELTSNQECLQALN